MRYLVVGTGGTGGMLSAFLTRAGLDVTAIARGNHLNKIKEAGLTLVHENGEQEVVPVRAMHTEAYLEAHATSSEGAPEVVFVCVKEYSLTDVVPFLQKVCTKDTFVIPILNVFGTGARLQKELPCVVADGCIYVAAQIKEPGVISMNGEILRVVYGMRHPEELCEKAFLVREDLHKAGVEVILSDNIKRDAFQKFSFVSPMAAAELYYEETAGAFQVTGDPRDFFVSLVKEIDALAAAMEIPFLVDVVRNNLAILDNLNARATTSLHRDILAKKSSEVDGLIYEVVRMGERYGVALPCYKRVAEKLQKTL